MALNRQNLEARLPS